MIEGKAKNDIRADLSVANGSRMKEKQSLLRAAIAVVLGAILVFTMTYDVVSGSTQMDRSFAPSFSVSPTASDSSTWYCSVPKLSDFPGLSVSLKLVNGSKFRQRATIMMTNSVGSRVVQRNELVPGGIKSIALQDSTSGPIGVTVDFSGGGDFVAYSLNAPTSNAQGFCQPSPGPTWTIQGLSTSQTSRGIISIYNPFRSDSIIDISLISPSGISSPGPLQAVVLRGLQSISVNISSWLQNQGTIGVRIQARFGRIVPGGIENRADSSAIGVAVAAVSPEVFPTYNFPLLSQSTNQSATLELYNYSTIQARVVVSLRDLTSRLSDNEVQTTKKRKFHDAPSTFVEEVPPLSSISIPLKSIASIPVGTFFSLLVKDTSEVSSVITFAGSASGPAEGFFIETGDGVQWPSWLSVLFENPTGANFNSVAVAYQSKQSGKPALFLREFLNGTSAAIGADGIDGQAGLALSGSRTAVRILSTDDPGGFPSVFLLRSSTYASIGVAYVTPDGSLIPVPSIATD